MVITSTSMMLIINGEDIHGICGWLKAQVDITAMWNAWDDEAVDSWVDEERDW